jgi:diguanylate cyclase (GGDEF)-like protein/PAS domain S-box-containing protein
MGHDAAIAGPVSGAPLDDSSRLRDALDALLDAFWLLEAVRDARGRVADFRVADLNEAASRDSGLTRDQAVGGLLGELVPPARPLGHIEMYARVVETGAPERTEFRLDRPGVAPGWRWIQAARLGDGVAVTVRDITARVLAEQRRAESDSQYRLLAEHASDMIYRITPDGRIAYVSPACREIIGYEPHEMVGRPDWEFVHPSDLERFVTGRGGPRTGVGVRVATYRGRTKGAGWVRLEATSRVVRDVSGRVLETRVATRDITERALAAAEHEALHIVSEAVAAGADRDELCALVASEVARLLDADGGRVVRYPDEHTAEVLGAWRRSGVALAGRRIALRPTWAIAMVRRTGETAVSELTAQDAARDGAGLPLGIAAPVRVEGELWGAVAAAFREPADAPPGAAQRVERFAKLVGLAVANAEARERLLRQAMTDALTGLHNHGAFHRALAEAVARSVRHVRPLSLAVIDLDHFKSVNDTLGHRAGDDALARVGAALRDHARAGDVVARVGGEEFAWLMPETARAGACEAAERLRRAVSVLPVGGALGLTASIGLAVTGGRDCAPGDLFRRADAALYEAKRRGRDCLVADRYE